MEIRIPLRLYDFAIFALRPAENFLAGKSKTGTAFAVPAFGMQEGEKRSCPARISLFYPIHSTMMLPAYRSANPFMQCITPFMPSQ